VTESGCHPAAAERRIRHADARWLNHAPRSPALLRRRPDHDLPRRLPGDCAPSAQGGSAPHRSTVRNQRLPSRHHRIGPDCTFPSPAPGRCPLHPVRGRDLGLGAPGSVGPADADVPRQDLDPLGWQLLPRDAARDVLAGLGQTHPEGSWLGRRGTGLDLDPEGRPDVPMAVVGNAPGGHVAEGDAGASDPEAGAAHGVVPLQGVRGDLGPRSVRRGGLNADRRPARRDPRHRDRSARTLSGLGRGPADRRQGATRP